MYTPKRALLTALLIAVAMPAFAASNTITYQGVLRDSAGDPVGDSGYPMSFSLYTTPGVGTGTLLWGPEAHASVSTVGGAFSVELGGTAPFGPLFSTNGLVYLEVSANLGSGLTAFGPRVPVSAAAYAFHAATAGDAATVGGATAASLEESADIVAAVAAHNTNAGAHTNLAISGAQITSGTIANARLNMGAGNGLDADTVDGFHAADLDDTAAIAAHNTNPAAHVNLNIGGGQITSGTINNARLNMGPGSGLDADTVDGVHAADLEESAEILAEIAAHNTNAGAHTNLNINGTQINTGTINTARLNVGPAAGQVAAGNHSHDASSITTGVLDFARIPTGISSSTVAVGSHFHNSLDASDGNPANVVFADAAGLVGVNTQTPSRNLEVNGTFGFAGNNAVADQTTGIISRAPRVIRVRDTRAGCPGPAGGGAILMSLSFSLTRSALVISRGDIIRNFAGRADIGLFVNGGVQDVTLTYTPTGQWDDAHVTWSGILGAGNHTLEVRETSGIANIWGCGPDWGSMEAIIYE